jgi:hypothetical protein
MLIPNKTGELKSVKLLVYNFTWDWPHGDSGVASRISISCISGCRQSYDYAHEDEGSQCQRLQPFSISASASGLLYGFEVGVTLTGKRRQDSLHPVMPPTPLHISNSRHAHCILHFRRLNTCHRHPQPDTIHSQTTTLYFFFPLAPLLLPIA